MIISFDYYCENANDNSVSSALITFRRSTAATGGTVTTLSSPTVSGLGLKNSAIDGKWVRATYKFTFNASNAVPAWYIFGLYMSNSQVGRTVRYKVREVMVVFGNIIPKSWSPAPEDQVTDWNVTDVNSFAFLKNKPTKLTDFANNNTYALQTTSVTAGNGLSGGGTLAANRTITLGTPSTLTATSTNTVGTTNHSHAITTTSVGAANTIVQTNASGSIISSKGAGFQNAAYDAGFNPI